MLLGTHKSVDECIIEVLARLRSASALKIHREICTNSRSCSLPAVYKELRKLQSQGILFKGHGEFALSFSWILNLSQLANQMYRLHTNSPISTDFLPSSSSKNSFTFTQMTKLDDFWMHALFVILQNSNSKVLYQWLPHPWFHLIHSHKVWSFHNALRIAGYKVQNIIGNNSFLDRYSTRFTTKGVYELNYAKSSFESNQSVYYSVSDSFLLSFKLDKTKCTELNSLYNSIKSWDDINVSAIIDVFSGSTKITASIDSNRSNIRKVWNRFIDYFNVSQKNKL